MVMVMMMMLKMTVMAMLLMMMTVRMKVMQQQWWPRHSKSINKKTKPRKACGQHLLGLQSREKA